jgi:hypothetical protein
MWRIFTPLPDVAVFGGKDNEDVQGNFEIQKTPWLERESSREMLRFMASTASNRRHSMKLVPKPSPSAPANSPSGKPSPKFQASGH